MKNVIIQIFHEGEEYTGALSPVFGGGADVYHLMVDKYYWGRLRKARGEWVFDGSTSTRFMEPLAATMGAIVEGTYIDTAYMWRFEYSCEIPVWESGGRPFDCAQGDIG